MIFEDKILLGMHGMKHFIDIQMINWRWVDLLTDLIIISMVYVPWVSIEASTNFLHLSLSMAMVLVYHTLFWHHSLMSSSHSLLGLPRLLLPSIMPKIVVWLVYGLAFCRCGQRISTFSAWQSALCVSLCYPPCSLSAILHYSIFCGTIWCLVSVCSISFQRRWVLWHLFFWGSRFRRHTVRC